jgi:hypothetical protein
MNERIQQLAEQAGLYDEKSPNEVPEFTVCFEKFAELLIKECAEIADNADATREKWQSIGKFVREHFGVQE